MSTEAMATILVLVSAVLHALSASFFKVAGDRLARTSFFGLFSVIVAAPAVFFVPFPTNDVWPFLLASTAILVVYQFLVLKSLEYGDLNYVYPLSRGTGPVFVVIISISLLGAGVGLGEALGVFLVGAGVMELASRGMKETQEKKSLMMATVLSILTGLLIASYTLIDATGVRMVENAATYIVWLYMLFSSSILVGVFMVRGRALFPMIMQERSAGIKASLAGIASYVSGLMALRMGSAIEIAALRETSIMFAVLIGYFFLGEGIGMRRLIAVALIAIGAVTIKAF